MRIINVRTKYGHNIQADLNVTPDHCPICHRSIAPLDASSSYLIGNVAPGSKIELERILQCPDASCQRHFISRYSGVLTMNNLNLANCTFQRSVPFEFDDANCSSIIYEISADYCEIYNQAHKAEQAGLHLIAGPGYRKALEFLIKDYLLKTHTDEQATEEIRKMLLGKCISTYVSSERIKQVASRAAWLGNDETHFIRKWDDKDLGDLKTLIGLTVRWIEMEHMTAAVVKDMPAGKS